MRHYRIVGRIALLTLVLFFLFFRLGAPAILEWDESRNGINAVEMLEHGHWRGLWFANAPTTGTTNLPFSSGPWQDPFHLLGYNNFALRFPSALATLGSLLFVLLLCLRYYGERFAWLVCLVLLSVEGIAGNHTGRTGDFDAQLIFFLLANSYFFLQYFSKGKERDLTLSTLFLAGAFMTKGPAMAVLLPGQVLFLFIAKNWNRLNGRLLIRQLFLFLLIPAIWLLFINEDQAPLRLFQTDVLNRFTDAGFETPESPSRFSFLFIVLDAYFNVWNYILFLLLGLALLIPKRLDFRWNWKENPLLVYSFACWLSLGAGLSLAATTHRWYFSPAIPFVAISLVFLIHKLARRSWVWGLFGVLLLFTLGRRAWEIAHPPLRVPGIAEKAGAILEDAAEVYYVGPYHSQQVLLYIYFSHPGTLFFPSLQDLPLLKKGDMVVALRDDQSAARIYGGDWKIHYEDAHYWVLEQGETKKPD
ncbi:MAG: glycosyltransferase family 39 protein [Saprospirales bacterium]|nr:glycosyltransferase family 39 protein [Saprospirales bacterium]